MRNLVLRTAVIDELHRLSDDMHKGGASSHAIEAIEQAIQRVEALDGGEVLPISLPPASERKDGMEAITFRHGKFRHVKWSKAQGLFSLGHDSPFIIESGRLFYPCPPRPTGGGGFYDPD